MMRGNKGSKMNLKSCSEGGRKTQGGSVTEDCFWAQKDQKGIWMVNRRKKQEGEINEVTEKRKSGEGEEGRREEKQNHKLESVCSFSFQKEQPTENTKLG